jgi:hypothetical protein
VAASLVSNKGPGSQAEALTMEIKMIKKQLFNGGAWALAWLE